MLNYEEVGILLPDGLDWFSERLLSLLLLHYITLLSVFLKTR